MKLACQLGKLFANSLKKHRSVIKEILNIIMIVEYNRSNLLYNIQQFIEQRKGMNNVVKF